MSQTELNPPVSPVSVAPPKRYAGRIGGLDIARALAIFGMFFAHIGAFGGGSKFTRLLIEIPSGRSSILFALLAGISLAIITGRNAAYEGDAMRSAKVRILGRSGILLVLAAILSCLDSGIAIILAFYAVWFVAAIPFLKWSPRKLFISAALLAFVGPQIVILLNGWLLPGLQIYPVGDINSFLLGAFVTGTYPGLVFMCFVLAGIGVGRLDLSQKVTHVRILVAGTILMVIGYGSSWVLSSFFGPAEGHIDSGSIVGSSAGSGFFDSSSIVNSADASLLPAPSDMPSLSQFPNAIEFVTAAPHSGTTFEVIGSGGFALFVLAICLLLSPLARNVLYPLAAAGSMALTVYTAQIIVLTAQKDWVMSQSTEPFLWLTGGTLIFCSLWKIWLRRGPLEWVMWKGSSALAAAAVPSENIDAKE